MGSQQLMKWAGYVLALAVGLVGLISGIASGSGILAGAGAGWLVDAGILIGLRQSGRVQGQPKDRFFAIFDNLPPWLWGLSVAILVVGAVIGYLIKH